MKIFILLSLAATLSGHDYNNVPAPGKKSASMNQSQASAGLVRHVVLFKFKETATAAEVTKVQKAFSALPGKIPTMISYEWGTNISPENLAQGFTHCFLVAFKNAKDRDDYLVHPAHKEFGTILKPYLDKVLVIDFVGQK